MSIWRLNLCSGSKGDKGEESEKEQKSPPSDSSMHFTTNSTNGIEINTKNAVTLGSLFDNSPSLCFSNYNLENQNHEFSSFSKEIFAKVLTISYQQWKRNGHHFKFDPNAILVKSLGSVILEVAVPRCQVVDPKGKSIYKDLVVGPFAAMVLSLCMKEADIDPTTGGKDMKHCYKEIYDLLYRAKTGQWWTSFAELLRHPLFWTLEEKIAVLSCFHSWMTPSLCGIDHGVKGVSTYARHRNKYPFAFKTEFSKNIFFKRDYEFQELESGELDVTESTNINCWKDFLIKAQCFGSSYDLGQGIGIYKDAEMLRQCRVMIVHLPDSNMNAFVDILDKPTVEVAIIYLDRNFSLSLSIYHTLRDLNVDVRDILAYELW